MVTMNQNLLPFDWRDLLRYEWPTMTLKLAALRFTQSATFKRADGVIYVSRHARESSHSAYRREIGNGGARAVWGQSQVFHAAARGAAAWEWDWAGLRWHRSLLNNFRGEHPAGGIGPLNHDGGASALRALSQHLQATSWCIPFLLLSVLLATGCVIGCRSLRNSSASDNGGKHRHPEARKLLWPELEGCGLEADSNSVTGLRWDGFYPTAGPCAMPWLPPSIYSCGFTLASLPAGLIVDAHPDGLRNRPRSCGRSNMAIRGGHTYSVVRPNDTGPGWALLRNLTR